MASRVLVIRGTNVKPVSSEVLERFFSTYEGCSGQLFIGYPIIGTAGGRYPLDAVLLSPEKGIVVFDLVEGTDPEDFESRQDDSANKLEAKLKAYGELMNRRDLAIPIQTITFAPGLFDADQYQDGYKITKEDKLGEILDALDWPERSETIYGSAVSAIESISTIRKSRTRRVVSNEDSRGAKLKQLEDSIATLDNRQVQAVIETVKGVQRIRGLAGSGKTIVLALKAAYLHAQHPDWRIAITFNTRSLKGQFRRLINNFCVEQTGEEPDWDRLRVLNAWGAPGGGERDGMYFEFCRSQDIQYFDFPSARAAFRRGSEFAEACRDALNRMGKPRAIYDAILIDEAQDFSASFLNLCFEMLNDEKRLVFAYDELQNLSGESLPSPEEIFGKNPDGTPRAPFESFDEANVRQDIILKKCYRNSRPVLITAHALGFGIYREAIHGTTGLVQMFDHPQLWEEIGYETASGNLKEGVKVVLKRTSETSPVFLESHSAVDDLVQFHQFANAAEQSDWLVKQIQHNIQEEDLRHDDIVVINPDPLTTRSQVGIIRRQLLDLGINTHLAGIDTEPDVFFQSGSDSITFTGIYRAKGNEAGMVYIINAQDCDSVGGNLAAIRNRLFTAMTRSKAWVRVLGVGKGMQNIIKEFDALKRENFQLDFRYPTLEEREHINIIHRDMTQAERKRVESRGESLAGLFEDLDSGKVHREDLDQDLLNRLKNLLDQENLL